MSDDDIYGSGDGQSGTVFRDTIMLALAGFVSLVVLLAPAVLVFIPGCQDFVKTGFIALQELPTYYQHLLYIAISASFGIKCAGQAAKMFLKK